MIKNLVILEKEPIKMLSTQEEKQPYIPAKRDRHVFDSDDDDEALVCFKRPVINSKPKPDSLNNLSSLASQSRVTNSVSRDTVEAKSVQTVNQTSYKHDSSVGNGKSIGLSKLTNPKLASSSSEQLARQHDNDSLEDSDDDMPLSSRFSTKKAEGNSVSRGSVQNINSTGMQRLNSSKNANCLPGRGPIVKEASAFIDSNANAKSSNKAPHHKADDQQDSDDDEKPLIFRTKAKKTQENSVTQNSNGGEPHFIKPPTALKKPAESSVLNMTNKSNVLNGGEGNTSLNHMKIHSAKKSKQMSLPKDNTRNGNLQHANQSSQNANKSSNQSSQNANKSSNQSSQNANRSTNQLSQHANKSNNQSSQHANKSSNQSSQHANQSNHSQSSKPLDPRKSPKEESDSDDEKPLVHRFTAQKLSKPPTEDSSKSVDNSDDEEPLAIRLQRNKKDGNRKVIAEKSLTSSKKRLLDEDDADTHFSAKKVKSSPVVKKESTEDSDDEDDVPIAQRMKNNPISKPLKSTPSSSKTLKTTPSSSKLPKPSPKSVSSSKKSIKDSKAKIQKLLKKRGTSLKNIKSQKLPPGSGDGQKWTTLEHNGVIFPPPYQPHGIKMLYNGKPVVLTPEEEEVATFFAVMKETDYATKPKFVENFWHDWKRILGPKHVIQKFELCDFTPIYEWHLQEKEKKKQMSTEEKKALKEEKLKQEDKYMWAIVDGVKEKVGNFRVEPPGLFRGRGEHPKMGKLKKRIFPEDITINVGRDAPIPECTMPGHRWKEIRHDNTVTWLAYWNDPINPKEFKYVFLAASSALKGLSDKEKYEKARMLKNYIADIRKTYFKNFRSGDKTQKQIAVATYLIDQLALRAGNEKDDDEADTVGCCTLKVENVALVEPSSIQFDFLGKDSIRYFNTVDVEPEVYKVIGQFKEGKRDSDDLFDELDTSKLNAHLKELMPGLTAKVFRTYNASITLDRLLQETKGVDIPQKVAAYQGANKEVAVLCNHQRSIPKTFDAQMERIEGKIDECKELIKELEEDLMRAKNGKPPLNDKEGKPKRNIGPEALQKKIEAAEAKLLKMDMERKTKENLKTVALGTSKINYLDPRITVAWCKSKDVPIEKIFNKSLLAKFSWAMDVEPEYRF